ncbi:hypothetical protein NDA16_000801 [Ustilago loliicola]|nr:hypothetical protein NDA16_000801 [Ustilago loliicola]
MLIKRRTGLVDIMPELNDLLSDELSLTDTLVEAYTDLASCFTQSKTDPEHAQAFAYFLVHVGKSHVRVSRDNDVLSTNTRLTTQFGRRYRGDAPLRFLNFVTKLNNKLDHMGTDQTRPYFRGTSVVQSSGTGKSRMVVELNTLTPLLYVCFRKREAEGNAKAGYPLPDQGVRKYFEEAQKTHPNLCDLQVACFLKAWFVQLLDYLSRSANPSDKVKALLRLNRLDRRNAERIAFFQHVSERAAQELADSRPEYHHQPSVDRNREDDVHLHELDNDLVFRGYLTHSILALNQELALLSPCLHHPRPSTGALVPPVLVAFDECVEINVSNKQSAQQPPSCLALHARAQRHLSNPTTLLARPAKHQQQRRYAGRTR